MNQQQRRTKPYSPEIEQLVREKQDLNWTEKQIQQTFGVSTRTQRRWKQKRRQGISSGPQYPNQQLWNNNNVKVTEEYVKKLRQSCTEAPFLYDNERAQLHEQTGIRLNGS